MSLVAGLLLGLGMGVLSGMGVGGGKLLIPALVFFYAFRQQVAQGIALVAFIPIAVMAAYIHYRQGAVEFPEVFWLTGGSVVGAVLGAWLATATPGELLGRIYGYFLMGIGAYELLSTFPAFRR